MNIEEFREYCLKKKEVTEEIPFGPDTLVFKVVGKVFAITGIDHFEYINLKCDPQYAIELRNEYYGSIRPGYHMNKKLWNSVDTDGIVPDKLIFSLIDHSYDIVVEKLSKKVRESFMEN